jgi:precorrin-3B synthase
MNAPMKRGLCPTLAQPMQTGDGLLVRMHPLSGGLTPTTFAALAAAATRHGNGILEVTARGNLQIRGLTAGSAMGLARDVDAIGIAVRTGVPVETPPLAGLDPREIADPTRLAAAIRYGIDAAGLEGQLGPKVSVVVDGGGQSGMDAVAADVRLTAEQCGARVVWRVAVAGDAGTATPLGSFAEDLASEAALAILAAIAALGRTGRARDLSAKALEQIAEKIELGRFAAPPSVLPDISPARGEIGSFDAGSPSPNSAIGEAADEGAISPLAGEMSGRTEGGAVGHDTPSDGLSYGDTLHLADSRFALPIALPFGQVEASSLIDFLHHAAHLGASEIRLAPRRTLLFLCPTHTSADAIRDAARRAGFIVDTSDPRRSIVACPGAPACAWGQIAARAIASQIAGAAGPAGLGFDLHVSGCIKRCAGSGHDGITLLGLADAAGLVIEAEGDQPVAHVAKNDAAAAIGRVAALLGAEKKPGEEAAACLRRLGPLVAQTFRQA